MVLLYLPGVFVYVICIICINYVNVYMYVALYYSTLLEYLLCIVILIIANSNCCLINLHITGGSCK